MSPWGNWGRSVAAIDTVSCTLTTRSSDSDGVITLTGDGAAFGYLAGDYILIQWSSGGTKNRYEAQITNVGTVGFVETITFTGGFGYKLPAQAFAMGIALQQLACRNAEMSECWSAECYTGMYADYGKGELMGTSQGDASINAVLVDCFIRGRYQGIHFDHSGSVLELRRTSVTVEASTSASTDAGVFEGGAYGAVYGGQGSNLLRAFDSRFVTKGHASKPAYGFCFDFNGSVFECHNSSISVYGGSTNKAIYEVATKANTFRMVGCRYDKSSVALAAGTLTDIDRIVSDTAGNAYADMRAVLGTALTESVAGRLAAADVAFGDVATPLFTASAAMRGTDSVPTNPLLTNDSRIPATVPPTVTEFNARTKATADYADKTTLDTAAASALAAEVAAEAVQTLTGAAGAGDLAALKTTIGAAGAGLTAIGDTRLANLNATVSSRQASGVAVTLPAAPDGYGGSTNASDFTGVFPAAVLANAPTAGDLGTGARTVTITVTDGTDPLENAQVRMTSGAESYIGSTNVSGVVVFGLDDATWAVVVTKPGYTMTPTTLVVSTNTTHTYAMTAVTIPASDPTFVTGYLYCYDVDGLVKEGVVVQLKMVSFTGSGIGYDAAIRSETSDAAGLVTFTNMVPGAVYQMRRGTETGWVDVTVSATATDPYSLDNLFGEDVV
jgi:hypothetical protein